MLDSNEPRILEILIDYDGTTIWINDGRGKCIFRACRIKKLILNDNRKKSKTD